MRITFTVKNLERWECGVPTLAFFMANRSLKGYLQLKAIHQNVIAVIFLNE